MQMLYPENKILTDADCFKTGVNWGVSRNTAPAPEIGLSGIRKDRVDVCR